MKVIREDKVFQPITIIIETQEEWDTLYTALNIGCSSNFKYGVSEVISARRVEDLIKKQMQVKLWDSIKEI